MRSIRVLISVARVADRLFQLHPFPVRIQFIGQNEWDGSAAAGAHLRPVRHQIDGSVGIDSHKHAGVQDGAVGVRTRGVSAAHRASGTRRTLRTRAPVETKPCRKPRRLTFRMLSLIRSLPRPP